ncbi:ABC transporter substrate-binding protein [Gammaproteobacteria bacterium]|jgi:phospholipid transport system substrate-binding protein|nr:ABC transporter substrate-binding protein [Gammaproteobacteria bacterium]
MLRRLRPSIFIVLFALPPGIAQATSPNEFIEEAVGLLEVQLDGRREDLANDKEALYALIDEILLPRFDRRFAAGQVLARHWRTASDEQRDRFVDAFYTTLLHRYAEGLLEFSNVGVEILPFRGDETKKLATVKTFVRLEDGTKVPVNYTLVSRDDGWRMFDVTIEGVSYVRNFRAEFDAEIRATSLEQVIMRLEEEAIGDDG